MLTQSFWLQRPEGVRGKEVAAPGHAVVLQVGPVGELMPPLVHRDTVGDQHQHALADAHRSSDAHQGLPSATGQHDDACSSHTLSAGYTTKAKVFRRDQAAAGS